MVVSVAMSVTSATVLLSPAGFVGSRAFAALESWRTKRAIAKVWPELTDVGSRLDGGGSDRRVVVEFVDYECPLCRQIAEDVSVKSASENVDVVVRHLPLEIHDKAREAALAAVCSEKHQVFPQAHMALLTDEQWLADSEWLGWAARLGVEDLQAFESCLDDEATSRRVDQDIRLAALIGVTGTPTFVTETGVFLGEPGLTAAIASLEASPAR